MLLRNLLLAGIGIVLGLQLLVGFAAYRRGVRSAAGISIGSVIIFGDLARAVFMAPTIQMSDTVFWFLVGLVVVGVCSLWYLTSSSDRPSSLTPPT